MVEVSAPDFAVVDLETTGFYPTRDRIIEVAIVRLDGDGRELSRYTSLVNPERDLGATSVHGIAARDVLEAPQFSEIVGDVVHYLRDAIIVGHNIRFDANFLAAELRRLKSTYPNPPMLDTLLLTQMVDHELPGRQLGVICEHWGICLDNPHQAAADALATAEIFRSCAQRMGGWRLLDFLKLIGVENLQSTAWPAFKPSGKSFPRDKAKAKTQPTSLISKLVRNLPTQAASPRLDSYLHLLDRVLEDRRIVDEEVQALANLASDLKPSVQQIEQAHREYMLNLLFVAYEDYDITALEEEDLLEVSQLLGITDDEYRDLRHQVENEAAWEVERYGLGRGPKILDGKTICFTGQFRGKVGGRPLDRAIAQSEARSKGMIIKSGVTKKLDFLVVADPYSMSGKARKANQ